MHLITSTIQGICIRFFSYRPLISYSNFIFSELPPGMGRALPGIKFCKKTVAFFKSEIATLNVLKPRITNHFRNFGSWLETTPGPRNHSQASLRFEKPPERRLVGIPRGFPSNHRFSMKPSSELVTMETPIYFPHWYITTYNYYILYIYISHWYFIHLYTIFIHIIYVGIPIWGDPAHRHRGT